MEVSFERRFQKFENSSPRKARIARAIPFYLILAAFAVGMSAWIYSLGAAALIAWILFLAMWALIFGIGIALCYGIYWIVSKQFGEEFVSFYHQNLCPRIKIQ